jgi:hypothetical protein
MGLPVHPAYGEKPAPIPSKERAVEALSWAFGIFVYVTIVGSAWSLIHGSK